MKKKTLVPLIIFLLGICLVGLIVYKTDTHEKNQRHILAQLNATTYGERIKNEIADGIGITDTLEQILISENGEIHQFETIAGNLMSDSIESVQLAPNGVVTDIYPAEGNEAGKIDLLQDKDRKEISCYARDNHATITQGPFELKQGGYGIAVRNPVYLKDKSGQEYFWGFTIVILRVPDIFSDTVSALSNFGYEYKILKTDIPWSDTYKVVYQSDGQIDHPVSYAFTVGDGTWKLEVTPKTGWRNNTLLIIISGMFLTISLLLSVLTRVWLIAKEHKNKYKILARTDSLTNIYNRYGFDELAEKIISKNPQTHFVAALLDIDDFKFINDIYGHSYGDKALKSLADSMKAFFPSDALLGRNGGDEFCILLPNCTFKEADKQLQQFTKLPKTFSYHGKELAFYISLGYAEYPTFAASPSQLMRCADAALYEIKLHGKNGCMAYRKGLQSGVRKQLGFALKDISEHLPGAFIIYRADKEDDELFYANHEFLHMTGYKSMDELFRLTQKRFRNLIRQDEQQQIETSIWEQIDTGNENDYIHFHLRKADGTYLSVLDHGRIVESQQYGKVFYVLFMDWEDMHLRYSDKFSE
ncbi:diguanylate cyclase domain-containing protein [Fusicatenibacter saccharivorans]|uniref:diguanylate cyclase domain-containing protein n=1 Tax=Fusicatenibacter saccharivorans TaxID=1150298 RepID=UPI00156EEA2F|nr:diguanylate cyclase [Fusicatenibacter saccharivorans]MCB5526533.1 diguanylate cyclase [Fusicatenibacter saccharivorans]MCB5672734.1 diguanylate cyclase [Fusicatenibacter saccharivorans]MCB5691901.1 diguanylate cyclase [Fusicatenibacter saccharivorans]MCB5695552.1 diguanylate cyclase [Fusicatenibacter saccharivorans]MCC2731029.1 diguanylate cyclase [Fusicatenibacter saccharivorans]